MDRFDVAAELEEEQHLPSAQQHSYTPAISAVCVDVRELLRRAAAAPAASALSPSGEVNRKLHTDPPSSTRLPALKQQRGVKSPMPTTNGAVGSTFWDQGWAAGGPPPLSPADPTILHAILSNPPSVVLTDAEPNSKGDAGDDEAAAMQRTGWSSRVPPPSRLRRPSATAAQRHLSARDSQRRAGGGSGGSAQRSSRHTASQRQHSSTKNRQASSLESPSANTHGHTLHEESPPHAAGEHETPPLFFGPSTKASDEVVDLSPIAQQALDSVLGRLHAHAAHMLSDNNGQHPSETVQLCGSTENGLPSSANWKAGGPLPLPPGLQYCSLTSAAAATQSSSPRQHAAAPFAPRGAEQNTLGPTYHPTAAEVRRVRARISPMMLADPAPLSSSSPVQQHRAADTGLSWQGSDTLHGEVPAPQRRTVPPAFRRQLQFAEAAPSTRRPKRK